MVEFSSYGCIRILAKETNYRSCYWQQSRETIDAYKPMQMLSLLIFKCSRFILVVGGDFKPAVKQQLKRGSRLWEVPELYSRAALSLLVRTHMQHAMSAQP